MSKHRTRDEERQYNKFGLMILDSGWVHHDPHPLAHGLWGEVLGELGPDAAGVAVGPGHLTPDHTEVRLLTLGLVGNGGLVLGLETQKDGT